jgi:hypothetical protein
MKTLGRIVTLVAGAALIAAAAQAQSTKTPQERMAGEAASLTGYVNSLNRECGTSITAAFDWTGLKEEDLATYSPSGWCRAALDGIERVCGDAPGKQAVQQKIKRVTCGFAAERSLSLKEDGTVDYKITNKSTNDADFAFETLENAL